MCKQEKEEKEGSTDVREPKKIFPSGKKCQHL